MTSYLTCMFERRQTYLCVNIITFFFWHHTIWFV